MSNRFDISFKLSKIPTIPIYSAGPVIKAGAGGLSSLNSLGNGTETLMNKEPHSAMQKG